MRDTGVMKVESDGGANGGPNDVNGGADAFPDTPPKLDRLGGGPVGSPMEAEDSEEPIGPER